ncbi:MAG TPA: adenylate/guanylate cyclase domain-containing protein [Terriglobales bacterium]|nr:adenylate/guanylate cyclase domain-containing protein [Terriglobales bacterium]
MLAETTQAVVATPVRTAWPTEPTEHIAVADIAALFTDLKGSSALYRRIGDAAAYRLIRQHFDLLSAIIATCDGMLVKTIGDAVMAVFASPYLALKAALAIQAQMNGMGPDAAAGTRLTVKLGIHAGSALAVKRQDRCDYFGEVVNTAAQLRDISKGGEIVLSQAVAEDSRVQPLLAQPLLAGNRLTRDRIALKGSDDIQPVARISRCLKIAAPAPREARRN